MEAAELFKASAPSVLRRPSLVFHQVQYETEVQVIEIPGYKVVRTLGKGGMATVYLAIQESFEREVALKVMSPALAEDPKFTTRFLHEARIVSRLVHPNIVTVYDVGVHENKHYLSMEYVPGMDLKQKRQFLTPPQSLQVIRDVARALDYASKKGYVHRDVKPENIMLHDDDGRAVLMDFGIACLADTRSGITQTGTAIGTPHYMSPEQAKGRQVDSRSDLYSLGVVLYLLLTGRVPYDADSAVAVGIKHVQDPIPRLPANLLVLQPIIDKALAKDPKDRFQTGADFVAAIDAVTDEDIEAIQIATRHYEAQLGADTSAETAIVPRGVAGKAAAGKSASPQPRRPAPKVQARREKTGGGQGGEFSKAAVPGDGTSAEAIFAVDEDDRRSNYSEPEASSTRWPWALAAVVVLGLAGGIGFRDRLPQPLGDTFDKVADKGSEIGHSLSAALGLPGGDAPSAKLAISPEPPSNTEDSQATSSSSTSQADGSSSPPKAAPGETEPGATPDALQVQPTESALLVERGRSLRDRLETDLEVAPELADLYRQALAAYPNEEGARWGLRDLRDFHYDRLREALEQRDLEGAETLFASLAASFPQESESGELDADKSYVDLRSRFDTLLQIDGELEKAGQYLSADALTSPPGANALETYRGVLAIDPENPGAAAGIKRIADRYHTLASAELGKGNAERAIELAERGLSVQSGHEALKSVRSKAQDQRERQRKVDALLAEAKSRVQAGALYAPGDETAWHAYKKVLDLSPENQEAANGIADMEARLFATIEQHTLGENFSAARAHLQLARQLTGGSDRTVALELALERAIEADFLARQPRIPQLLVSSVPPEDVNQSQSETLQVERTIHIGFSYTNFAARTTVVQAMLYDGSRSVQIAQVPVIVSGKDGVKYFQIDRPVEGFAKGAYTIDLILENQRLASQSFKVERGQDSSQSRPALTNAGGP